MDGMAVDLTAGVAVEVAAGLAVEVAVEVRVGMTVGDVAMSMVVKCDAVWGRWLCDLSRKDKVVFRGVK